MLNMQLGWNMNLESQSKNIINWKNLKPSKQPYKVACLELQWIFDADSKVKLSQLFPNLNGNEDIHLVMSQVCTKEQIK